MDEARGDRRSPARRSRLRDAAGAQSAEAAVSIARRFHVEARDERGRAARGVDRQEPSSASLSRRARRRRSRPPTFRPTDCATRCARPSRTPSSSAPDESRACPTRSRPTGERSSLRDRSHRGARRRRERSRRRLQLERLIRGRRHAHRQLERFALYRRRRGHGARELERLCRRLQLDASRPIHRPDRAGRRGQAHRAIRHRGAPPARARSARSRCAITAVRRAVDLFGARKPPTMRVPVIFERDVAASLLDDIFSAVSGANVAVGNSWLSGRVGSRIGSDLVNVVDDGRLPGGLGSVALRRRGRGDAAHAGLRARRRCGRSSTTPITRASSAPQAPATRPAAASARTISTWSRARCRWRS